MPLIHDLAAIVGYLTVCGLIACAVWVFVRAPRDHDPRDPGE